MKKSMIGLAVVTAIPMFSTMQVAAAEDGAQSIEKIQVTGSRIKRTDMETSSPVTLIGADDIQAMGASSIDGVLQKMTASSGAMTNPAVNNGSGGNARVNLRGLGAQRTLVLVNGRRMINSGTGVASTVDLNTIPVSMIKQIEVLKDGASAVYGTDAVAGVVNIILKDDFEGLEMNLSGKLADQGDADETTFDLTMGSSSDRGNVVIGLQYTDRGDASQADRNFSDCPITEDYENRSFYCGGSSYSPFGHILKGDDISLQGQADGGLHDYNDAVDGYNYSAASYLYTPMRRLNLTGVGHYDITDDTRFTSEFTYSKRWSSQQLAPQPIWIDDLEYNTATMGDSLVSHGIADGDKIAYRRRMTDIGPRGYEQVVDTVRAVVALEGALDNGWGWDTSVVFGRNDSVDRATNLLNMGSIKDSIAEGDFNPLNQAAWSSANLDQYNYTENNSGGSQLFVVSAGLNGEVMELPAGYVGFAAGIERREEKAWEVPDSLTSQGLANDPRVEATSGRFDVNEAYVEFAIPLVADVAFADNIDLSAAVRAFDYSTFGSDETWKLGLTWRVNDELMLRGVRSTAFRAPTVDELYSGKSPSFEQISTPGVDPQAEVTTGGNDKLTPEEAKTLTAGIVYAPNWFDGFSLTVDYYDIEIENAISDVNNKFIVNQCFTNAAANSGSELCQTANVQNVAGRLKFNNQLQNIGSEQSKGYDVNMTYKFDTAGISWKTAIDVTILDEYIVDSGTTEIDYKGLITAGNGSYAKVKTNFTVKAAGDNWDMQYQLRLIDGADDYSCLSSDSKCLVPSVGSVSYHDISGSYIINDTVSLNAGVNNLFDKEPPYYSGNYDSNTDPYTYDVLGRRYFAGVSVKF